MKRSEMSYALEGLLNALDARMVPAQYPDKAAAILEFVENAGMLPPLNEETYHFMDNDARKEIYAGKQYFTWEDEDETK